MDIFAVFVEALRDGLGILLHLDVYLNQWVAWLGPWSYGLLMLILFCETGLVVLPFLPGDSLLFAIGALAATDGSPLQMPLLFALLPCAVLLGDTTNYAIGRRVGPRIFSSERSRWLNPRHLHETQAFYERHGGATIIMARFVPIVRTFAPFVAGIGRMRYRKFVAFSIGGALLWVWSLAAAGYLFGNIPIVKNNFEIVVLGIIALSTLPIVMKWWRSRT